MKVILVFLLFILSFQANALDGNQLLEQCEDTQKINDKKTGDFKSLNWMRAGRCMGIIEGLGSTHAYYGAMLDVLKLSDQAKEFYPCIPDKVTNYQQLLVLLNYLKKHPEELHKNVTLIVHKALIDAFPCD